MNELSQLEQQLREKLASAQERRQLHQQHAAQRMAEIKERYEKFARVAEHVAQDLIRPRLELLASHFDNAEPRSECDPGHCYHSRYQFRHTERFPGTVTLDVGVSPDASIDNILVVYNLEILPMFFRFEGKDQIGFPVNAVDEARLVAWVEKKIHDFVDTYLRLEQSERYQRENIVIDPVCGMQINKAYAAARMEYHGQTYYFCVEECRAKFAENPPIYVKSALPGTHGVLSG
jgi:YHS domain-containing protein